MIKKVSIIIICIFLLTGCWDKRELDEIGLVVGTALDKDPRTGDIIVTFQVVRPQALKKEGGGKEAAVEMITTKGSTIFDALRNVTLKFDRRIFIPHTKVIAISEEVAKDGIKTIIDYFIRDEDTRPSVWMIIAKNAKARDILGVELGIETIQAAYLEDVIRLRGATSKVTAVNLLELVKKIAGEGIQPIAGVAEITEELNLPIEEKEGATTKGVSIPGTAVFKGDKLVGFLNEKETRGLNWAIGKVESGILHVPSPTEENKLIAIELKKASGSIKPEIKDGKISFVIEVKQEGGIGEYQGVKDVWDLEFFEKIEKAQIKVIEQEINMAADRAQKEFHSDIFGFGSALSKKYPKEWKEIKDDWEDIFPDVPYSIKIDAKLRRTGLISKPITPAE